MPEIDFSQCKQTGLLKFRPLAIQQLDVSLLLRSNKKPLPKSYVSRMDLTILNNRHNRIGNVQPRQTFVNKCREGGSKDHVKQYA